MKIVKLLWKHFLRRVVNEERGTWGAIAVGIGAAGLGYSIYSGERARGEQQEVYEQQMSQYESLTEPQKEQMRLYTPLYEEQVAMQRRLLPKEEEYTMAAFPYQMGELELAKQILPYRKEAAEKLYTGITARGPEIPEEDWARIWQRARERIKAGYGEQLTALGERAAGAGGLRGGPVQAEATKLGIAEAESLAGLGLEESMALYGEKEKKRREYINDLMSILGIQPSTPAISAGGVSAPGMAFPTMPTAPTYESAISPYEMGQLAATLYGMKSSGGKGGGTTAGIYTPGSFSSALPAFVM